jgi:hypothetical protein
MVMAQTRCLNNRMLTDCRLTLPNLLLPFVSSAIAVTLQLPQVIEKWSNDKVLRFIHFMWTEWNKSQPDPQPPSPGKTEESEDGAGKDTNAKEQSGPAAPATVVRAAKQGLTLIGNDLDSSLHTEPYEREISETSPVVPANATMLERTQSGTIRVPPLVESHRDLVEDMCTSSTESSAESNDSQNQTGGITLDPMRKNRNLEWLRAHFRSLNEVSHLPFNSADLWKLHQYFFSPILLPMDNSSDSTPPTSDYPRSLDAYSSAEERTDEMSATPGKRKAEFKRTRTPQCSPMPSGMSKRGSLDRNISFQMLDEAVLSAGSATNIDSVHKRRSTYTDDEEESEHASKRSRSFKPRIAYYPRIRVSRRLRLLLSFRSNYLFAHPFLALRIAAGEIGSPRCQAFARADTCTTSPLEVCGKCHVSRQKSVYMQRYYPLSRTTINRRC